MELYLHPLHIYVVTYPLLGGGCGPDLSWSNFRDPHGDKCTIKSPQGSPWPIPSPDHPSNKQGQLIFQPLREDLRPRATGAISLLLQMHKSKPRSAVKHKHARSNMQCLPQQPPLPMSFLTGNIKTNTQVTRQKEEGRPYVLRTWEQCWVWVLPLLKCCVTSYLTKAHSLVHINPRVIWTHMDLEHP